MLAPVTLWPAAWNITLNEENQSWYIIWPMFGFLGLAALWHIALIIFEREDADTRIWPMPPLIYLSSM
jgi:hypothetical protein